MNRVEVAIQEGRCVLVFGARALAEADTIGELRRRGAIPSVVLAGDGPSPAVAPSTESLAPALAREGGVIALIEAESTDAVGLNAVAAAVSASPHKPRLVVVARSFNPFGLPPALRTLKFEHDKKRAKEFLFTLPVPEAVAAAAPVEEPKKKGGAPKAVFVGREEELAQLRELLATPGPIVVHGPAGVGKRWLVEQALVGQTYDRHPDFYVGWGSEADSLYARIALAAEKEGDTRLAQALRAPADRPVPAELAALAAESFAKLDNALLVIDRLEHVLRRDGTFHRESRFELLLRALLLGGGRVVFLSTVRPRFYREGEGSPLRILDLEGLKGRELHEVFDAYRVEDFPREHFGDIWNRIHGHPFAARMFAIAVRDPEHRDDLMNNKKFMTMQDLTDAEPVKRRLGKSLEALSDDERVALYTLAHFRLPHTAADAKAAGVDRDVRLALQARGLLDQLPEVAGQERTLQVHALVQGLLPYRETSDHQRLEALGEHYLARAEKADGLHRLALAQEGNRLLFEAFRTRNRYRMPFPDNDPALESVRGMIRGKKPRFDLAMQRLGETLKVDPANTELLLLRAELKVATKAAPEDIQASFAEPQARAPTPEAFHVEANFHQQKTSGRGRAAACLERAIAAFPANARLRRRLAGIYVDQNKLDEATRVLKEAMDLEPMMADTYGLLGEIHMLRGGVYYDEAEAALSEARRLDPDNALHMARLGALMFERGGLEDDARAQQIEDLLTQAVTSDQKSYTALLYLGRLILERGGDLERADWAFKKATKLDERAAMPLVERARVMVRKNELAEANQLLDKAVRLEPGCHAAFYVRGEVEWAQGNPFSALAEFQKAVERSPKGARARAIYEEGVARMRVLIESGAYAEVQRAAEAAAAEAGAEAQTGLRREPGKTVQRRRRGGRGKGEAPAAEAGAEGSVEAGAEGSAEAGAEASADVSEAIEMAEAVAEAVVNDEPASAE